MSENIKECFISRYREEGWVIEADYSQLEVYHLAHLSGCRQLLDDLLSGRDMHVVRAAEIFDIPEHTVTKEQRKMAKGFTFALT